jgi:hypothetical protein
MAVMHEGMLNPAEHKFIKKCWGALPMTMEEIFCIKEVRNSATLPNCELLLFLLR